MQYGVKPGLFALAMFACVVPLAVAHADDLDQLLDQPIKDLAQVEVTSVSKRAEKASEAAAAVFVITQEDIKRSGANSIPEVLRMAPGIQVARIDANKWAISIRGFGEEFAKKLLVLIDGRSVYNPLDSGVYWEEQGVPLEDIERIEIIRGPGSTLWGANAVNGVINIITKSSKDTQGNIVSAGIGTFDKDRVFGRTGGKIGDDTTYRTYLEQYDSDGSKTQGTDETKNDGYGITRGGFRTDGEIDKSAHFTLQGDVYNGNVHEVYDELPSVSPAATLNSSGYYVLPGPDTVRIQGGNVLGRYDKTLDDNSQLNIQMYYDVASRTWDLLDDTVQTIDFDAQHSIHLSENHDFIWGLGYRFVDYDLRGSDLIRFDSPEVHDSTNLFSGFLQDKIQIVPDKFYITVGSKFEHNDYTGIEVEPNIRATWLPTNNQTVWGAISRAVRTPSEIERTLTEITAAVPTGLAPPNDKTYIGLEGVNSFDSEDLIAYELGYRIQPTKQTSIDVSTFINDYSDLRSLENAGTALIGQGIGQTFVAENRAHGIAKGIEVVGNWQVSDKWSLSGSYSYIDMNLVFDNSTDVLSKPQEDQVPHNTFNIRSHYKITDKLDMDNAVYFNDNILGTTLVDAHGVSAYTRLDSSITWRFMDGADASLIGQNLLDKQHQEFGSGLYNSISEIPRSVFGKVTLRF